MRWVSDKQPVDPPLLSELHDYHLFISYSWLSGQHQARAIKQGLLQMIPTFSFFLDIDDLKFGYGAKAVLKSQATLIFVTAELFRSANCMREVLVAMLADTHLVVIHDEKTMAESRSALAASAKR